MTTLKEAATNIQTFEQGDLRRKIALVQNELWHKDAHTCQTILSSQMITPALLDSALVLKRLAGQINVIVHAVGIILSLPYILREGELIEGLSLGAGNTGEPFDLTTNQRIAEFKFIHWKGGPESIRQNQLFKDFYLLAEFKTPKECFLYVVDEKRPLKFFNGGRALSSVMSRNNNLWKEFQERYPHFKTVKEYYNHQKTRVKIVDLMKVVPEFSKGFDFEEEVDQQNEDM